MTIAKIFQNTITREGEIMAIAKIFQCVISKGRILAFAICFAVSAHVTADDKICIHDVASSSFLPTLDGSIKGDIGWIGSNQYAFLNGTSEQHGRVQLTRDTSNLYVSFEIDKLPRFNAETMIVLLIGPQANDPSKDYRIHIYPGSYSGNATNSQPLRIVAWKNSTNWTQQINCEPANSATCSTPTSLVEARVTAVDGGVNDKTYLVEMRIKADATGLSLPYAGTDIKLAFNALRVYTATIGGVDETVADQLNWPTNGNIPGGAYPLPGPNPDVSNIMANPVRANWGTASLLSFNQSCPGVQVKRAWINTESNPNELAAPAAGANSVTNVLHVEVENTGTTAAGNVLGTISSSRFGSNPYINFGKIGPPVGLVNPSNPVSSYDGTLNPIGAGQVRQLQPMNWTLTRSEYQTLYSAGSGLCSVVELDVDTAHVPTGVQRTQISNRFFGWNIHMAPASIFRHKALLESYGYAPSARYPSEQRFELMVTTQQIPARAKDDVIPKDKDDVILKERSASLPNDQVIRLLDLVGGMRYYREGAAFFVKTVCPYRHTGRYIRLNGQDVELMERAPCFEYWIHHVGKLAGWSDSLSTVSDKKLVMDGNQQYSIRMDFDKSVELETRIEAVETPIPTQPPCQCGSICAKQASNDTDAISGSLVLVGSLGVGGFAFLRRKRKQDRSVLDERAKD